MGILSSIEKDLIDDWVSVDWKQKANCIHIRNQAFPLSKGEAALSLKISDLWPYFVVGPSVGQ